MHVTYPLARIEDINDDLAEAITKALGATASTATLSLRDILDWHHGANPDENYQRAVHAHILELANALQLHSITNGRPELYETYQTDSEHHNKLLMSLGVYTEDDRWSDDFIDYRTLEWEDQTVLIGLPYIYHPDIAQKTYRLHRAIGKTDQPYGLSIEHYTFIETVDTLSAYEEHNALEALADIEMGGHAMLAAPRISTEEGIPLDWTVRAEHAFDTKVHESLQDTFDTGQLRRLAKLDPEDALALYAEWLRSDYPLDEFDQCVDCYLDIREAGYPFDVSVKALQFKKTGPEVIELFEKLTVEYAFQLL